MSVWQEILILLALFLPVFVAGLFFLNALLGYSDAKYRRKIHEIERRGR